LTLTDLASHTDAEGNTTQFFYDRNHGLLRIVDPLGRAVSRTEYDDEGRLVAVTDAAGHKTEYEHDPLARQSLVRDALGRVTLNEYDERGNVVATTDPLGGRRTATYDAQNNLLSETDPLGATATYRYDANNHLVSATDPLGHTGEQRECDRVAGIRVDGRELARERGPERDDGVGGSPNAGGRFGCTTTTSNDASAARPPGTARVSSLTRIAPAPAEPSPFVCGGEQSARVLPSAMSTLRISSSMVTSSSASQSPTQASDARHGSPRKTARKTVVRTSRSDKAPANGSAFACIDPPGRARRMDDCRLRVLLGRTPFPSTDRWLPNLEGDGDPARASPPSHNCIRSRFAYPKSNVLSLPGAYRVRA
jgi:YD repeat-containing protein